MKVMISCKEATKRISKKEEGKLSVTGSLQLWYHLTICGFCKLFYRQNKLIIKSAANLAGFSEASLSGQQKQQMVEALETAG